MEKLSKSTSASRAPSIGDDNIHSRNNSNNTQQSPNLTLTRIGNDSNNNSAAATAATTTTTTINNNSTSSIAAVAQQLQQQQQQQRLSPPQLESQLDNERGGGEEYEILCNEMVLPLTMTLAAVRQFVWKQSSELVMHYRRKRI